MEQSLPITFPSGIRIPTLAWNGHKHLDYSRERGTTQLSDFITAPAQQHREEEITTHPGWKLVVHRWERKNHPTNVVKLWQKSLRRQGEWTSSASYRERFLGRSVSMPKAQQRGMVNKKIKKHQQRIQHGMRNEVLLQCIFRYSGEVVKLVCS